MFTRKSSPAKASTKLPAGTQRLAVEALVDVSAIEGDVVKRKDGTYAALLEVEGEAFTLLTMDEQDLRIEAYGRVLTGLRDGRRIQVTRLVEPTNLSPLQDYFTEATTRAGAESALGQLAGAWNGVADRLSETLLSHVTIITVTGKTADDCREQAAEMLTLLSDNGFAAKQCDAERLGVILQTAYGSNPVPLETVLGGWTHEVRAHFDASERADKAHLPDVPKGKNKRGRREGDTTESGLRHAMPTLRDVLEPAVVLEKPGHLDLGGVFVATLVARTWPEQAHSGWLEWLYTFEEPGVRRRVSFHIESLMSSRVMADLRRRQVQLDAETRWSHKRGLREDLDIELGSEAIEFLRQEIGRGRQRMFLTTLMVTVMADRLDRLQESVTRLMQKAAGYQVKLFPLYLEESHGFRATMPLGTRPPLRNLPTRGIPTVAMATTFPFSAGEVLDPVGDVWGENESTGNLVVLDPHRFQAKHMVVVAKTRSGKSAAMKVLATQALFRPDEQVIVIDPSPPIDYERWTRWLGGTYAQFGPGSADGINPLEIMMPASMDRIDDSMRSPIRAKIAFAAELLGLMASQDGLSPEEQAAAEEVLTQCFANAGMPVSPVGSGMAEWATVRDPGGSSLIPQAKAAPTLTEVWEALSREPSLTSLALRIKPFVTGMFNMFAGSTTVDMTKQLVVFNVHNLIQGSSGKQHQAVAYAMISEYIRWRLAQSRRRTFVIVDEGHVMFQREDTAKFVSQLFRMAGKQGGRVALLTQGIVDIMGDPATGLKVPGLADARYCMENAGFKLLMRNDSDADIDLIMRTLGMTPSEGRAMKDAKHGQGILIIGDPSTGTRRAYLKMYIPPLLYPWITTKPEEVEYFRQQGVFRAIESPDTDKSWADMPLVTVGGA